MASKHELDTANIKDLRRHRIVGAILAMTGVAALPQLWGASLITSVTTATPQLTRETLNGIAVFFVPGADPFSAQQGEVTTEPGAFEAGAGEGLHEGLNFASPFVPDLADTVAEIFNSTALAMSPAAAGPFQSSFANLAFMQKARVFAALEGNPATAQLVGILPLVVGFLTFAESAFFDPLTLTLRNRPAMTINARSRIRAHRRSLH
jgi:hypothetical protein